MLCKVVLDEAHPSFANIFFYEREPKFYRFFAFCFSCFVLDLRLSDPDQDRVETKIEPANFPRRWGPHNKILLEHAPPFLVDKKWGANAIPLPSRREYFFRFRPCV
jgi:hypothetical protein